MTRLFQEKMKQEHLVNSACTVLLQSDASSLINDLLLSTDTGCREHKPDNRHLILLGYGNTIDGDKVGNGNMITVN